MSMAEYCRSFGVAMKEAGKRVTSWVAFYHTGRRSWYPKPEGTLLLSQVPFMKPLANVNMRPADCDALGDWASSYDAAARQRTVHKETTMARQGTLPEFMYQRQCEIAEKPISTDFDARVSTADAVTQNETVEEAEDEFDESIDEEVDDGPEVSTLVQGEIGSSATFLLGERKLRQSCAFQQSSALLTSSSDYANF